MILSISGSILSWTGDGVSTRYNIYLDSFCIAYAITATSFDLSSLWFSGSYNVSVRHVLDDGITEPVNFASLRYTFPSGYSPISSIYSSGVNMSTTPLVADKIGNIYGIHLYNSAVQKVDLSGALSIFAGSTTQTGSLDGVGSAARFTNLQGIAIDPSGNIYVSDYDKYVIQKITPDGTVSTVAGLAGTLGYVDGSGVNARFRNIRGLACDNSGNVYIADDANSCIRKMTPNGVVSTVLSVVSPMSITVDGANNLYYTTLNNRFIYKYNDF